MKTNNILFVLIFSVMLSNCQQHSPAKVEYFTSENTKKLNRPYSDAVRYGNLLFLSGNLGTLPGTRTLDP